MNVFLSEKVWRGPIGAECVWQMHFLGARKCQRWIRIEVLQRKRYKIQYIVVDGEVNWNGWFQMLLPNIYVQYSIIFTQNRKEIETIYRSIDLIVLKQ